MDTKHEILEQTFNLTMKYGVKSVSMDDIARNIGISKKTIYRHFKNKKDLIHEMVHATIAKDQADINFIISQSKDAVDQMVSIARHILMFLRDMSPSLVYDMQKYYIKEWSYIEKHHEEFIYGVIKQNIERGIKEGYYLPFLNPDVIAKLYGGMSHLITDEEVFPLKDYSKSTLYENLVTYHMRGIVTSKGLKYLTKLKID